METPRRVRLTFFDSQYLPPIAALGKRPTGIVGMKLMSSCAYEVETPLYMLDDCSDPKKRLVKH